VSVKRQGRPSKLCIEVADEGDEVELQRRQPIAKLDHVQPPLTALDITDGGLAAPKQLGQVSLAQAARLAQLTQTGQKDGVRGAVDGFFGHVSFSAPTLPEPVPYSESESAGDMLISNPA
jgi:hypothetical protein